MSEAVLDIRPNFFIVGAPKAGTSSLYAYLKAIPGVFMSDLKEPNYFSRVSIPDEHPVRPVRDPQAYLRLFEGAGNARIVGEASPTYLADPDAPRLIREFSPDAKILISLRDPVERAYSHYLMMRNNSTASGSFLEEIQRGLRLQDQKHIALLRPDVGLYYGQVRRYRETFSAAQLQVIVFEEFMADVRNTVQRVIGFLGIDHDLERLDAPVYRQFAEARGPLVRYLFGNRTIARASELLVSPQLRKWVREKFLVRKVAKPAMEQDAREFLTDYYREDVRALAGLLGRELPWRNFTDRSGNPVATAPV